MKLAVNARRRGSHAQAWSDDPAMSKTEILNELPQLTSDERQEIRQRLAELDDDITAFLRAEELQRGDEEPKNQAEVFANARVALH